MLLIGLFLGFMFWYKQANRMGTTASRDSQFPDLEGTLLIAKQDSPFKDSVIAKVLDRYKSVAVSVQVIDVVALKTMDVSGFDAILLVYRWEARNPPEIIASFIHQNLELKNKMVVLTTSWNGLEKMENIDAITGASIVADAPIFSDKLIKKIDHLLKLKN